MRNNAPSIDQNDDMRSSLILPALLLTLAPIAPPAGAEPVVVTVTMHDPRALDVSYRMPPSCKALTFVNPGIRAQVAALVRSDWTPAGDCTDIDFQSIRPRHAACTTLRLRVPATTRARDRRLYDGAHPWAQPFGDGLYAHTAAYAVQDSCGPVEWRFEAPGGTVMADGVVTAQAATASGAAANPSADTGTSAGAVTDGVPVLLLAAPFRSDASPFHAEAEIDQATQTRLAATVRQSLGELQAMLPALPLRQGYVLAAASSASSLRTETPSPNVIRLLVPATPLPDFQERARALLGHEAAHLAQPANWRATGRDAWREAWQDDLPAIREGGAEFLRLAASVRLGWLTPAQLKDEFEAAVNSCLMTLENKPWRAFDQRNGADNAWRCGLTLHLLGLARINDQAGGQGGAQASALQRLQDYYARARAGTPTDVAHALECGAAAGCAPRRLARVRGAEPLAAIVRDEARSPDSLLHAEPAWGPALVETMVFRHLEQVMRADCRGGANIAHDKAAPRIGPGLRCGVLRSGMVVTTAEGLPLFADDRAVKASAQACRGAGVTMLGLQDGRSLRVACGRGVALPQDVFGVDAEKAMALTK